MLGKLSVRGPKGLRPFFMPLFTNALDINSRKFATRKRCPSYTENEPYGSWTRHRGVCYSGSVS